MLEWGAIARCRRTKKREPNNLTVSDRAHFAKLVRNSLYMTAFSPPEAAQFPRIVFLRVYVYDQIFLHSAVMLFAFGCELMAVAYASLKLA